VLPRPGSNGYAKPEPAGNVRQYAGGAIDLDEIATPEILDPREVKGPHSGYVPGMF
jgi:hypothetical protein